MSSKVGVALGVRRVSASISRLVLSLVLLFPTAVFSVAPSSLSSGPAAAAVPRNEALGIAHIGYGSEAPIAQRYQQAVQAGAGWNRWALYWHDIERSPGALDYSTQDATVAADRAHGLKTLGILFGTPNWASTAPSQVQAASAPSPSVARKSFSFEEQIGAMSTHGPSSSVYPPRNLESPVFSDGTDVWSPGKTINPENVWARFAYETAYRYRGQVNHWEVWNEPDFAPSAATGWFGFWAGGLEQYYRLLKVAALAIRAANPEAKIVLGGMAYWFDPGFFPRLLDLARRDASAPAARYYFDITSWHWYSQASLLYDRSLWVRDMLTRNNMGDKQVWVTETTLPVCGDPQASWTMACSPGSHTGEPDQQASFVIQAVAYAFAAGVEKIFIFQLYDDRASPVEGFGLIRNDGSPRPSYGAFQVAATYLRDILRAYRTPNYGGQIELAILYASTGRRVMAVWNGSDRDLTGWLPAEVGEGALIDRTTKTSTIVRSPERLYYLPLPRAMLNDSPPSEPPNYIVGGAPFLIAESGVLSASGRIEGAIKDLAGRPVSQALIAAGGASVVSDAQGRYSLPVWPGLYDLSASKAGYFPQGPFVSIPLWGGQATTKDITLPFEFQIRLPFTPKTGQLR